MLDIQTLQILDSSDDCIKVLDLDGRLLFMNRGGQALVGIEDFSPFLNASWIEFWPEAERQSARDAIARAAAGEVCSLDGYWPTLTGEPKWWNNKISPIRNAGGQVERLLCVSRDITERRQIQASGKQAEEKLRESEGRYQAIVNQAVTGVACVNLEGRLTLVNQKYCDITGYSADELYQRRMQDITHPEDLPRNVELFMRMLADGTPFEIEKRYIRKNGSIVWVNNSVYAVCDRDGKPQSVVAIVLDITERKQSEMGAELLANVTQNLAEANRVEDIIQAVGEQLNRYLHVSTCALIEVGESGKLATIVHNWHRDDIPSLVGRYHLPEFVTGEFFQTARLGQSIIVQDIKTDSRIAEAERFTSLNIGSFISVPLTRDHEWKYSLGIYHQTPYPWSSHEVALMRELANRVWTKLERIRVEVALRQNHEMFSALVGDAPFGVYMIDAEFRVRQANQAAIATFNLQPLIGRNLAEALRSIWQEPFATEAIERFRHTLITGEPYHLPPTVEYRTDIAEIQSYDWQLYRITLLDGSYGVVCYFYDLSEIKRAEEIIRRSGERDAFLVTLNDTLRPLTDAIDIQATASRVLGEHLNANRVAYFEVQGADYVVAQDYVNGAESLRGGYPIESFSTELLATYRRGHTAAATEVMSDPDLSAAQRSAYAAIQIAAYIGVPLVKQGEFMAGLAVHSSTPRRWTADEIALVEEVAEHTWAAVERARAEAELRASEAKYRGLFESLDEGYFLADVIFDENDRPIDILYLEANSAAARMVGQDFTGQRLRKIAPNYDADWYESFGRVARTGRSERLEQYAKPDQKWYDFYVFKVGDEQSRRVSVVFKDITQRKRREAHGAFLTEIEKDFSRFSTANEIMQTVGAKIGAFLQITTCNFTDVDEAHDRITVHHGWSSPEVPSTVGTFCLSQYLSKEFERASRAGETVAVCNTQTDPRTDAASYAALEMYSFVTVPFHQNGRWTHYIAICHSQPRTWRDDEIELIEEISNRIFPRLERARAEAALRESEARFRTVTATVPQLIWTATPDGQVDYMSEQWADYVGLSPEQLYGWNWQQVTHPEDLPNTVRDWRNCIESGEPVDIKHRFRHRTGEWRWQLVRGVPVKDATGAITKWVGTCTDIQDEVDIKEALRESEAKYRSLFDSIDEGFCIIEVLFDAAGKAFDYRFLEANAALERQTGLKDVIGKTMREFAPNMEAYWYESYGEVALTGIPKRFENTAQELGRFYDVYAFRMGEPHEHKVAVLFNDISDRKRAEQDLRESEEWARIAIQVAKLGGWRLHLDTELVEMDERMGEIWGEPKDAVMIPLPQVLERMHPGDRDRVAAAVSAAIDPQSTGTYEIEYRIVWNDGTERWVLAKGQAQFEGEGECRRTVDFFGTLLDITDRKQAEVEREHLLKREQSAREDAEQANRIKDEFLAVLSHELRSPLNPILGWSTLLLGGKLDAAKTSHALTTIQRNAKLQSELIEDLLDVSRILRGKLNLNVAPVNLANKIRGAMETVQLAAEAKAINLQFTILDFGLKNESPPNAESQTSDVMVWGDSTRLQQVVWNLLSNAVKFTPEGGQVDIQLERVDSFAQITVTDTGQGISPDFLPYMFDYFRQADGTTTRKFGGLGLGLAIVRHLVELHGGTVSANSSGEGQGATFTIRLPLLPALSPPNRDERSRSVALGTSPQRSLDLSAIKILVVDDEPDTRELVVFILEQQGAQVITAASAHEALLLLPRAKPDLLLSDVGMPEMDGYMLIRQVRELAPEDGGQIPAIALTAYAGDTNQQQVLAAGFQQHISKPIEPEKLVHAIARLLPSR
ncbi:PAS domain S-box protein [Leptolyngbya sp. KIOST-1]|uniref:PAS domain S-box protein n=1 Tax=Leptolyngbya sp. KIOST-1 TaxID=1229172 RepID=UPI0009078D0F|nr:PAS domain S-box protein [Leptolyngbya sp. KIOST-1]